MATNGYKCGLTLWKTNAANSQDISIVRFTPSVGRVMFMICLAGHCITFLHHFFLPNLLVHDFC